MRLENVHDVEDEMRRAQHVAAGIENEIGLRGRGAASRCDRAPRTASCMLARRRTECAMVRKRRRAASARASGAAASRSRMRSIDTHWRTLMPSGQTAVHWPLPLQASTQRAAPSAAPWRRASARRDPRRSRSNSSCRGRRATPSDRPRRTCRSSCSGSGAHAPCGRDGRRCRPSPGLLAAGRCYPGAGCGANRLRTAACRRPGRASSRRSGAAPRPARGWRRSCRA